MKKQASFLIKLAGLLFIACSFLLIPGCDKDDSKNYTVKYEVTGSATFASYFTPSGEQSQSSISTPWSYSFSTSDRSQNISLRAGSTSSGTVYVKVYLNGNLVLSDSESNGLTAITGTYRISDFL